MGMYIVYCVSYFTCACCICIHIYIVYYIQLKKRAGIALSHQLRNTHDTPNQRQPQLPTRNRTLLLLDPALCGTTTDRVSKYPELHRYKLNRTSPRWTRRSGRCRPSATPPSPRWLIDLFRKLFVGCCVVSCCFVLFCGVSVLLLLKQQPPPPHHLTPLIPTAAGQGRDAGRGQAAGVQHAQVAGRYTRKKKKRWICMYIY